MNRFQENTKSIEKRKREGQFEEKSISLSPKKEVVFPKSEFSLNKLVRKLFRAGVNKEDIEILSQRSHENVGEPNKNENFSQTYMDTIEQFEKSLEHNSPAIEGVTPDLFFDLNKHERYAFFNAGHLFQLILSKGDVSSGEKKNLSELLRTSYFFHLKIV